MLENATVLRMIALNKVLRALKKGGKSGLHMAAQRVTPFGSNVRNSGTERMSRATSQIPGTGGSGEPLE